MSVSVLEQAKIQAQVLVPLVKALQAELGKERANKFVRKALGDVYRGYGEAFWRAKNERNVGKAIASAFSAFARDDALDYRVTEQSPSRSRLRDAAMPSSTRSSANRSSGSCWCARPTSRTPTDSVLISNSRAHRPSCRALAIATSGTGG